MNVINGPFVVLDDKDVKIKILSATNLLAYSEEGKI